MSHRSVETIIGRLVTDEGFRRRFLTETAAVLDELRQRGCELTPIETQALAAIDPAAVRAFARVLDERLQKIDLAEE
jgi:hypothetical protein